MSTSPPALMAYLPPLPSYQIDAVSAPRNFPMRPDSGAIGPPADPLAMAVIAPICSALARSSMTSPTDQFPFPISCGV